MSGAIPAIPRRTFPSSTGGTLPRGLVYTYIAGTSTPATTWQDIGMTVPNQWPIPLDTTGSCTLWTDPSLNYKFQVYNAGNALQYTLDNVLGSGQSPTLQQSHVDTFSGNGVNKIFTLSAAPASINDTNVYIAGAYQEKSSYTLSGTTLTFVTAPTLGGSNIEVTYYVLLDFTGLAATIAGYSAAASASASDAQTSALAASTSEANAAGSVTAINNRIYPGTYTVAPTTRPDGSARLSGDEYFDGTANKRYTYNGATWVASDINTANLAASSGSSLVGDGTTTVADRLSAINLASYTALRAYAGANQSAYITGYLVSANPSGTAGLFTRDDTDTTSADNGGTIIVASNGKRWKRVFSGAVSAGWFGLSASASAATNSAALAAVIAAADNVSLPPGNFTYSGLAINKNNFSMFGAGKGVTTLTMDSTAANAISIASSANTVTVDLAKFTIVGNAANLGGIALGSASFYASWVLLDEVGVTSFTNATAQTGFGISLNQCQEVEIRNPYLYGNRNNLYRPVMGFTTSTRVFGKAGYIGHATGAGAYFDGGFTDLYIQDIVCEGNALEGIYLTSADASQGSSLFVQNVYFEANGDSGSGTGFISAVGNASPKRHKVVIESCSFHYGVNNTTIPFVNLDQAIAYVGKNGLFPQQVKTTATCQVRFDSNRTDNAGDWLTYYKLLSGNIIVTDFAGTTGGTVDQVNMLHQITFPATQVSSTDANTLDDYEEGTWTPTCAGFTGTITSATGEYQKVGNRVHWKIVIQGTNVSVAAKSTGNCTLPYAVASIATATAFDASVQTDLGLCYVVTSSGGLAFTPAFGTIAAPVLILQGTYRSTT